MDPEWREFCRIFLPYFTIGIILTWIIILSLYYKNKGAFAFLIFIFQFPVCLFTPIFVLFYIAKSIIDKRKSYTFNYINNNIEEKNRLVHEYGPIRQIKVKGLLPSRVCKIYALVSRDNNKPFLIRINGETSNCYSIPVGDMEIYTDGWNNQYEFENGKLVMKRMINPTNFIANTPPMLVNR